MASSGAAKLVAEAIETATPLRRCTKVVPRTPRRSGPCAPAQIGVSTCPCSGDIGEIGYKAIVDQVVAGLTEQPLLLLGPLEHRMRALADAARYEEAAAVRDRAAALSRAIARQRRLDALRRAGRVLVEVPGEGGAVLEGGRLVAAWASDTGQVSMTAEGAGDGGGLGSLGGGLAGFAGFAGPDGGGESREWGRGSVHGGTGARQHGSTGESVVAAVSAPGLAAVDGGPLPRHLADEVQCVASWLDTKAARIRLLSCDGELCSPLPRLPRYEPRGREVTA
jgi:hypothetical protein